MADMKKHDNDIEMDKKSFILENEAMISEEDEDVLYTEESVGETEGAIVETDPAEEIGEEMVETDAVEEEKDEIGGLAETEEESEGAEGTGDIEITIDEEEPAKLMEEQIAEESEESQEVEVERDGVQAEPLVSTEKDALPLQPKAGFRVFNFTNKLILMCLIPMIVVSVAIINISSSMLTEKIENQIEGALQIVTSSLMETYNSLYEGDYSQDKAGRLSKGDTMISKNTDLIDALKEQTEFESSMIYGDRRLITTIKREAGGRIQGTNVDKDIYEKVMKGKSVFRTDVKIQETEYYAYYQPLLNSDGSVCGMVGSARPSAEVQKMIQNERKRIISISVIIIAVSMILMLFMVKPMAKTMKNTKEYLSDLADGDLAVEPDEKLMKRKDELGDIYHTTVKLQHEFRKIVNNIKDSVDNLTTEADGLTEMAQGTRLTVDEVFDSVELINKSATMQAEHTVHAADNVSRIGEQIEYITQEVDTLTKEAGKMADAERESESIIKKLNRSNEDTIASITNVANQINVTNTSVKKIRKAASMIQNISEETDLLSLNASIEAARAGEAGKGFAVVAEQICKLADQSSSAAEQIEKIIEQVISESAKMVEIMEIVKDNVDEQQNKLEETKQKFNSVALGVDSSRGSIENIRQKMRVLGESSDAILQVIDNLAEISEKNVDSTEDTMASARDMTATMEELEYASTSLRELSSRLDNSLNIFKM